MRLPPALIAMVCSSSSMAVLLYSSQIAKRQNAPTDGRSAIQCYRQSIIMVSLRLEALLWYRVL
jgi:hypothetical protein